MRGLSTIPRGEARRRCAAPARGRGVATRRVEVDLSLRSEERIAVRVAQILEERRAAEEPDLLSAGELARRLRVERPWVYRNRDLLGGLRIGVGPKAPWRFEYAAAVEALRELQEELGREGDRRCGD